MSVTHDLVHEHEVIKRVLKLLDTANQQTLNSGTINKEFYSGSLEFLRLFADTCHHGKEEKVLFPAIEQTGISTEGGPVGQMLIEHEQGREYLRNMEVALKDKNTSKLIKAAADYVQLLQLHIAKENDVLFPLAEVQILPKNKGRILEEYERIEIEVVGEGMHDKLLKKLDKLEKLLQ